MNTYGTYQANQPYNSLNNTGYVDSLVPPIDTITLDGNTRVRFLDDAPIPTHQNSRYGNDDFLNRLVKWYDIRSVHYASDWSYKHRHSAQEILPFMFLGPMNFARDTAKVREAGITMMIAVRSRKAVRTKPNMMNPAVFAASGVQTATFDVDTPYDIVAGRCKMIKMINDHLEKSCQRQEIETGGILMKGKVLVFCETGNERSPVLPALYIMAVWGLSAISAVQAIQSRRFGIALDYQMVRMLQNAEVILAAERDASGSIGFGGQQLHGGEKKRNIDQAYDEEMTVDEDVDLAADTRLGTAPFRDMIQQ